MVIGTGYQDAGLFHAHFLHQLEIFMTGPDPAGNLRECISPLHAFIYGVSILLAVQEKLACPDQSVRAAELMKFIKDVNDLIRSVRSA